MRIKQRFYSSFVNAGRGLKYAVVGNRNTVIMLIIAALAIALGIWFHVTRFEWAVIFICIGAVLAVEFLNTAIEKIMDMIHPEHDSRVGEIKDIAAAASLIISIAAGISGLYIFMRHMNL